MFKKVRSIFRSKKNKTKDNAIVNIERYVKNGRIPWSEGYHDYKFKMLYENIRDVDLLKSFRNKKLPNGYGKGLDERIVEIPWVIDNVSNNKTKFLDAGSSFNFDHIVSLQKLEDKDLTIFTFDPETNNFASKRISYVYEDLRELPFKDSYFDEIASISTIEHVDMDNSIYGWNQNNAHIHNQNKSYEYLKVIHELNRVLKPNGSLLITFPFGKFENHGFFQQFDDEMLLKITDILGGSGEYELDFFKYTPKGWEFCNQNDCKDIVSYNPHTGKGKLDDGAAHCRSVCCIKFKKNK